MGNPPYKFAAKKSDVRNPPATSRHSRTILCVLNFVMTTTMMMIFRSRLHIPDVVWEEKSRPVQRLRQNHLNHWYSAKTVIHDV